MSTTYAEPFSVARFFASLDMISHGRAGWNLVTSLTDAEARNFGRETHAAHADRYARAREFAQVVLGLWDTWEDDAMVYDKAAGVYLNPDRLHFLNHKGPHFSVRGPLMVQRSPQGRPVVVQAGGSDDGRQLAAETAEVIFAVSQEIGPAREFYNDVKARAVKLGRAPESIKVLPGVMPVVGKTRAEAEAKYEELQDLILPEIGVRQLSSYIGVDLTQFPIDGPVPEPKETNGEQARVKMIGEMVRRDNLTALQEDHRPAGPSRPEGHGYGYRRRAGGVVQGRRLRRLQRAAADVSARSARILRGGDPRTAAARFVPPGI
jgi:FMN-dependent oxidoreductase (nitrilotriacetate monooxygenase family)